MRRTLLATLLSVLAIHATAQDTNQAKDDCEAIVDVVLPVAQRLLTEHGEFFPFGGTLQTDGKVALVAGYDGREHPPSSELIKRLTDAFRSGARSGQYKATALVYDVRVTLPSNGAKSDAIAIALDHRDEYSVVIYFPYQIRKNEIVLRENFAEKGEAGIFDSR